MKRQQYTSAGHHWEGPQDRLLFLPQTVINDLGLLSWPARYPGWHSDVWLQSEVGGGPTPPPPEPKPWAVRFVWCCILCPIQSNWLNNPEKGRWTTSRYMTRMPSFDFRAKVFRLKCLPFRRRLGWSEHLGKPYWSQALGAAVGLV